MFKRTLTIIILSITAFLASCQKDTPTMPAPFVIYDIMAEEDVYGSESFIGKVDAATRASISARVGGFLEKQLVNDGDYVKKDQILFVIEKSQYIAAAKQAEGALAQAKANALNASMQRQRGEQLYKTASISKARYDDIVAADQIAKANVESAQAALDAAKLNLSYTDVRSPVEGKVGLINFNIGETVGPASGVLTTVIAQDPMYVVFSMSDKQIQDLRKRSGDNYSVLDSSELEITLSDGSVYPYRGKLNFIDNMVASTTDSVRIRGEFQNPYGMLTQGQTVNVKLISKTPEKVIVVNQAAIQNDISGKFVMLVVPKKVVDPVTSEEVTEMHAQRTSVVLGSQLKGGKQVVLSGLKPGDMVIVEGIQKIQPNKPINPMTKEQFNQMLAHQAEQAKKAQSGGGK